MTISARRSRLTVTLLESRLAPATYQSPYTVAGLNPAAVADIGTPAVPGPRLAAALAATTPAPAGWYDPANYHPRSTDPQAPGQAWGPAVLVQPRAALPAGLAAGTSEAVQYYEQRLVAAATAFVGTAYQHHHQPTWNPYTQGFTTATWPWTEVSTNPTTKVYAPQQEPDGTWKSVPVTADPPVNPYRAEYGVGAAGIDCSDLTALAYNAAAGISLDTAVGTQGAVGPDGTSYAGTTTIGWNDTGGPLFVDHAAPTATGLGRLAPRFVLGPNTAFDPELRTRYVSAINPPGSLDGVIAQLRPGDLLYIAGSTGRPTEAAGDGHRITHVVMWLGEYATGPGGARVPLVVSSHDNTPGVLDANGQLPPPGVRVLPFDSGSWFYTNFSHAMRVLPAPTGPAAVTVTAAPPTAVPGQAFTLSVGLASAAGVPAGVVEVRADGGPAVTAPLVNGGAAVTLPGLPPGRHTLTVSYPGGGGFAAGDTMLTVEVPAAGMGRPLVAAAAGPGGTVVRVLGAAGQTAAGPFTPFPGFAGPVHVAGAVVGGRAVVVAAAGEGGGPHVVVLDAATGAVVRSFMAYDHTFRGGAFVAVGDLTGDGSDDLVTGAGPGGGPHVRVFDGATGAPVGEFMAYATGFRGGIRVAAGDVTGDGRAEVVTAPGAGGGPHVRVFGPDGEPVAEFMAGDAAGRGGVYVAVGDLDGDGKAEVVTGGAGDPAVWAVAGGRATLTGWPAAADGFRGERVAVADADRDGQPDLVIGAGRGDGPRVRVFAGRTLARMADFFAGDPDDRSGVFVG